MAGARSVLLSGLKVPAKVILPRSGRPAPARARLRGAQLGRSCRCRPASPPARWSSRTLSTWHLEERALFHLLNLAREQSANLLFTARSAPARLVDGLPDLASRLREIPVVDAWRRPTMRLLRAVLVKLFADRQLAGRRKPDRLSA